MIAPEVKDQLTLFRQNKISDPEAGGMLLGRLIDGSPDAIIDEITRPQKRDRWGRLFFWRDKKHAQTLVNRAWATSAHSRIYLGEWHTHPEDNPTPSQQDITNWHSVSTKAVYEQDFLFFIIVGIYRTRAWEIDKSSRKIVELHPLARTILGESS